MEKARILIVEDEAIVAMDIADTLRNLGHEVTDTVPSGEQATASVKENRPDVILMDIGLKGEMDGIQTAEQIRSQYSIPVIFLTAYADEKTLERAKITAPCGYLTKPFEETDLRIAIEVGLYRAKLESEREALIKELQEALTERKQAEEKLKQAQETLSIINNKLEERNRQNSLLSEMGELLQSCSTVQEVPTIVNSSVANLFPGTDGALFLLNNSRTDLQSVARWGDFPEDVDNNIFVPDACWGLRQGRAYAVEDMKIGPICPHLKQTSSTAYLCLPLIGKGETLGLLHLGTKRLVQEDDTQWNIAELKETAVIFAEYLSLAIANIKLSEKLASQSIRDTLTGLFNRRYMEETSQREILRAARKQTKIGIIMVDIDHFKQVNDTYGHEAGDEFLIKLADFFKLKTRGSDIACRYGGEEFILILPESSVEETYKRADYLREEIKKMKVYFRDQLLPSITLSFGIATYPDHGTDIDELIRVADTALYKAKEEGRDRVIVG
jgi:diguanylate cyclase (GGDEF)-like protein